MSTSLLLFLIVASLIMYFWLHPTSQEMFQDLTYLFIDDGAKEVIHMQKGAFDSKLMLDFIPNMRGKIKSVFYTDAPPPSGIFYDDVVVFSNHEPTATPKRILTATSDIKIASFVKTPKNNEKVSPSVRELMGKNVGILHTRDVSIAQAVFGSYDMSLNVIKIVKVSSLDDGYERLSSNAIDALLVVENPENPLHKTFFETHEVAFYSYDDMDLSKLQILMPYAYTKDVDYKTIFPRYHDKYSVRKTLVLSNVIYQIGEYKHQHLIDILVGYFDAEKPMTTFLSKYFSVYSPPKIERFEDDKPLEIIAKGPLDGFYDSDTKTFETPSTAIDGIPLQTGDTVVLNVQKHLFQNGRYKVDHVSKSAVVLNHLDGWKTPSPAKDKFDERYMCFPDRDVKHRGLCESKYDLEGNLKPQGAGVWDRPCDHHEECPFFQKNKNYKNYRGGCNNGFCEVPIGTTRIGYRQYTGKPWCHGCAIDNPTCCDKQQNPDYAFPMDELERDVVKEQFIQELCGALPFINGMDFNMTEEQKKIYHQELENDVVQRMLEKQIGFELIDPPNMKSFLQTAINSIGVVCPPWVVSKPLVIFREEDQKTSTVEMVVAYIIYRDGKSHGKGVVSRIQHDLVLRKYTILDTQIKGTVISSDV